MPRLPTALALLACLAAACRGAAPARASAWLSNEHYTDATATAVADTVHRHDPTP